MLTSKRFFPLVIALAAIIAIGYTMIGDRTQHANMQKITIPTAEGDLAGNLFLPESGEGPFPTVVVTGSWTSVKEQMPNLYAAALADKGYAAVTFDFRGWGESAGIVDEKHRYLEDPARKTEDIKTVLAAIGNLPQVDANRIGMLGICASAGYASRAVAGNDNVQSLALVAPWLHNAEIVDQVYGGKDGVASLIQIGRDAEAADNAVIIEAASLTNEDSLMYKIPYYTEKDRGLIAEYDNKFNLASWERWLTYDAVSIAQDMDKQVLVVHSENAAVPQGTKQFLQVLGDKGQALWLNDANQFDFYDGETYVSQAVDAVAEHFDKTL